MTSIKKPIQKYHYTLAVLFQFVISRQQRINKYSTKIKGVVVMNKKIIAVVYILFFMNLSGNAWAGNVNFFLGQKTLDKDDWEPVDKQPEFGVLVDFKQQSWPVSIALDFLGSKDETTIAGINVEGNTAELDFGVRKIWDTENSTIRPYIGGGVAFIRAEVKGTLSPFTVSVDDSGAGLWIGGGIYWTLNQSFNLGLDLRYSQADVTLAGTDVKAGGTHAGILLGYHW
ncbi:MAG: porin family protein [Gammaproteobacteria bacterium]|nr:porin family protein [Gammaproteobacteria bacterium]